MTVFDVNQVDYDFGRGPVLQNISFQVAEGECFGIIGPNGGGKSTLVKVMSGLLKPRHGEVRFCGCPIGAFRKKDLARKMAVLEQESSVDLSFNVQEIAAMGRYPWLRPLRDLSFEDEQIVEATLRTLELWDLRDQPVNTLSGGQRQLVNLARAMVQQPEVLILDEPTTYLDIGHQRLVMEHIRRWRDEKGITVIMVLHDLNLAGQYCDKLLLLEQGNLRSCGQISEVLQQNTISSVYRTKLVVIDHPVSGVPQFLLTS